jgi:cytochrome P450
MREIDRAIERARRVSDAPAVELCDYDDVMFALRAKAFAPIQAESGHGGQWHTLLVGDSVVDLHGGDHFERRRLLSGLFKKAALVEEFEHRHLIPAIEGLRARLLALPQQERQVDVVSAARRIMVELMSHLIGTDIGDADYDDFEGLIHRMERGARSKFVADASAVVRDALEAQTALVADYFQPAWDKRVELVEQIDRGALSRENEPNDVITLMVRHRAHYDAFGEDAAFRELSLLLTASVGSVTNAVCFALWDLHTWLQERPEDAEKRSDRPFLQRCFAESLRLGQTNPLLRTAVEDVNLPSGIEVKSGEVVVINRPAANAMIAARGTSARGATEYDPYRELPANTPQFGLAFGGGAHRCIGKTFAVGDFPSHRQDEDALGIGVRLFAMLEGLGAKPLPSYQPELAAEMVGRPTWKTLPVTLDAI